MNFTVFSSEIVILPIIVSYDCGRKTFFLKASMLIVEKQTNKVGRDVRLK